MKIVPQQRIPRKTRRKFHHRDDPRWATPTSKATSSRLRHLGQLSSAHIRRNERALEHALAEVARLDGEIERRERLYTNLLAYAEAQGIAMD